MNRKETPLCTLLLCFALLLGTAVAPLTATAEDDQEIRVEKVHKIVIDCEEGFGEDCQRQIRIEKIGDGSHVMHLGDHEMTWVTKGEHGTHYSFGPAHLGSGASLCAMRGGRSVDSTMGFTALDGLPMGTRPGAIDPGVVLYLIEHKGMDVDAVTRMLYHDCGLKGLSGISNDVRELVASDAPGARLALDYFAYRIAKEVAALASVLGGLDALVFTAGIGENAPRVRSDVCRRLAWLGVTLDDDANARGEARISRVPSAPAVHVVATDEERMIALHTLALVGEAGG